MPARESRVSTLYHYTDTNALRGVLETGRIWATDYRFLNDSTEAIHAFHPFMQRILDGLDSDIQRKHLEIVYNNYIGDLRPELYVACFSEARDDLAQWRGYCSAGGYVIGFERSALEEMRAASAGGEAGYLQQVQYADDDLAEWGDALASIIRDELKDYEDRFKEIKSQTAVGDIEPVAKLLFETIGTTVARTFSMSACFKSRGFQAEKEWRLILARHSSDASRVKYRNSKNVLVPYVELPVSLDGLPVLSEVIVSPGVGADLRAEALRGYLGTLGYRDDTKVSVSELPYLP